MKKLMTTLMAVFAVICVFGLIGCNETPDEPIEKTKYSLSVKCGENGSYEISHEGEVEAYTRVTLTVKPDDGYEVDEVKVNDSKVNLSNDTYSFTVKNNTNIIISFKAEEKDPPIDNKKIYTVKVDCGEGGEYEITKEGEVEEGTEVTLTAKPNAGYVVDRVLKNGMRQELTANKLTFNVTENTSISIIFAVETKAKTYTVKVECGEGGEYEITKEGKVEEGTKVTLTAKPNAGFVVERIYENGKKVDFSENKYTFEVNKDTTIAITFRNENVDIRYFNLKINCGVEGSYVASAEDEVAESTEVTITITPNVDYDIDSVMKNGKKVDLKVNICTFVLTEDSTISITFKAHEHTYGAWSVTQIPTFEETGMAERECKTCSEEYTNHKVTAYLPDLTSEDYKIVEDTNTAKDCLSTGKADYTITVDEAEIRFNGESVGAHKYGDNWIIDSIPSLTSGGSAKKTCSVCDEDTAGHEIHMELPILTDSRYTKTNDTSTCIDYGTAQYSITLEEQKFTFEGVTQAKGHDFSDPSDPNHCKVCHEEKGMFESYLRGTWKTESLPLHQLEFTLNGITIDSKSASNIAQSRTDSGDIMYICMIGETKYSVVVRKLLYNNESYYLLDVSYKLPLGTDVYYQFYNDKYPIDFSNIEGVNLEGYWSTGSISIQMSGKMLKVAGGYAYIKTYKKTTTGFTMDIGQSEHPDEPKCTITYTKTPSKLEYTYFDPNSRKNETKTCSKVENNDTVSVPADCEGTYESNDKAYKIVVDSEGKVTFNDVKVVLREVDHVYYVFIYDGIAYKIVFNLNRDKVTLTSQALGGEFEQGIALNKQQ